jgi:hypothetical protein
MTWLLLTLALFGASHANVLPRSNRHLRTLQAKSIDNWASVGYTGQITALALVNSQRFLNSSSVPAVDLKNNTVIPVNTWHFENLFGPGNQPPQFNINASVSGREVQSVLFTYNGRFQRVENGPIFAFCGNDKSQFYMCSKLGFGTHNVTATPYSKKDATGLVGLPMQVIFSIVEQDQIPPTLLDIKILSSATVDVTSGDAKVDFSVTL